MPAKAAVTDMTFFGAGSASSSKPKPKLPDIKKRDPSAYTPLPLLPPAQATGTSSLLSTTMSQLLKRADSPIFYPALNAGGITDHLPERKVKLNKKGHTVRFRDLVPDGGELVSIRVFHISDREREEQQQDDASGKSSHEMDIDEGQALRAHEGIEEVIDWYEPDSMSLHLFSTLLPFLESALPHHKA